MVVEELTAARLLEQWRTAERRRDALMPGSAEHDVAAAECEAMKAAYHKRLEEQADIARQLSSLELSR